MKILWAVNTLSPYAAEALGISSSHAISWVEAMSCELKGREGVSLAIAVCGGKKVTSMIKKEIDSVTYYVLPYDVLRNDRWGEVISDFCPDIIHVYGCENAKNLPLIESYARKYPMIISLQGIIHAYHRYYYAGMTRGEILTSITAGDLLLKRSIFHGKRRFKKQAELERRMLCGVSYVEGRSDWDRVFSECVNRRLKYYHCPRMIRRPFYEKSWNAESFEEHTILVHQASYPIKGLHVMLEALDIIRSYYPDVKMYIAGNIDFNPKTLKKKLLYTGYTRFIKKKIKKLGLENNIEFTGYLDAEAMAQKLSRVNVCVVPSAIENAPNALAEAMLVGTPCVSSYAGGSPDMLMDGKCGLLYRFEEPEMLAYRVRCYFDDPKLAADKSQCARHTARQRHAPETLTKTLLDIYSEVVSEHTVSM